eukprot:2885988-Lingulodinium_polyedra.AAC.1
MAIRKPIHTEARPIEPFSHAIGSPRIAQRNRSLPARQRRSSRVPAMAVIGSSTKHWMRSTPGRK